MAMVLIAPEPPLRVTRPGSIQALSSGHIVIIAVEHAGVVSCNQVISCLSSSSWNHWGATDELGSLLSVGIVPNTIDICIRPFELHPSFVLLTKWNHPDTRTAVWQRRSHPHFPKMDTFGSKWCLLEACPRKG